MDFVNILKTTDAISLKFLYDHSYIEERAKSSRTFLIIFKTDVRLFSYFHKVNNGLLSIFM